MNITLAASVNAAGSPEITSPPWTANAGDTVLVAYTVDGGSTPPNVTFNVPGYTWQHTGVVVSTDGDMHTQGQIALNVPAGTHTFTTTGLGFGGIVYHIFVISGPNTWDQTGMTQFPNPPGPNVASEITTTGPLAATGEAAIAWMQGQYANLATTVTPMPGWTGTPVISDGGVYNATAAYNASAGTIGQPLTGGWSAFTNSSGNNIGGQGVMVTFAATGGGAGAQPGFPRSAAIEEPSEGMQESNVTPPNMGTPN